MKRLKVIERDKMFAAALPAMGFNAEAAAVAVGVTPGHGARVQASRLLAKPSVQAMVAAHVAKAIEKSTRGLPAVIAELEAIGFSNMTKFTRLEGGRRYIDFTDATEDDMRAVAEIVTEDVVIAGEEDEEDGEVKVVKRLRTKLKLHDKQKALVDLLRWHTIGAKGLGASYEGGTNVFNINNMTNNVQVNVEAKADNYRAMLEAEQEASRDAA